MSWKSIADLLTDDAGAAVALLGAPMEAGSVTPGRCDLAPDSGAARAQAVQHVRPGRTALELELAIRDAGDVPVQA